MMTVVVVSVAILSIKVSFNNVCSYCHKEMLESSFHVYKKIGGNFQICSVT